MPTTPTTWGGRRPGAGAPRGPRGPQRPPLDAPRTAHLRALKSVLEQLPQWPTLTPSQQHHLAALALMQTNAPELAIRFFRWAERLRPAPHPPAPGSPAPRNRARRPPARSRR